MSEDKRDSQGVADGGAVAEDFRDDAEVARERKPGENEPAVYIVGLGQAGRELMSRLIKSLTVFGIDVDESKIKRLQSRLVAADDFLVHRDATSRLTWEELGLDARDTVVTVSRRDDVNLEVCRVVREYFKVKRVISLIRDADRALDYGKLDVETMNGSMVLASFLESRVLQNRRTAQNVGLEQGEIMEVPILAGSPVIGRPLRSFHARPWLVGAVYRKDRLIVPHGNTIIREGDRVVLVGEPHILHEIADFFRVGEPEFPLQYGPRIGVISMPSDKASHKVMLEEANYLAASTKATSMVMLTVPGAPEPDMAEAEKICGGTDLACEPAYLPDEEHTPWPRALQAQDFGCLVIEDQKVGLLRRLGVRRSLLLRVLESATFPVLVSRGTQPYEKILVPVSLKTSPFRVAELAINLARLFNSSLDAVTVTEPVFSAGEEAVEEQKGVLDQLVEFAALYKLPIEISHREGNPIQEIVEEARDFDLVVMGHRHIGKRFLPRLDLALEIMARCNCSVMILPFREEG